MKHYGNSSGFEVKVGMHQGSALSPLLFVIVMEATHTHTHTTVLRPFFRDQLSRCQKRTSGPYGARED